MGEPGNFRWRLSGHVLNKKNGQLISRQNNTTIMIYHILNGDALAFSFPDAKIGGDIIVIRETLIDGKLAGDNLNDFWQARAEYHVLTKAEYHSSTVEEFRKILDAPDNAEFYLWFEFDLFCQVNMWFVISLINILQINKKVCAVYTSYLNQKSKRFWNGFGLANSSELASCFSDKILLNDVDLQLGQDLWTAYKSQHLEELIRLGKSQSAAFPYLKEVIKAHVDRFPKDGAKGRPEKVIEDITRNISTDFDIVLKEFWNRESIYGFGDTQVKHLYNNVMHYR